MDDIKELNIVVPEGYIIDKENSTFEKIVFKKEKRWRDNKDAVINGFFLGCSSVQRLSDDMVFKNTKDCHNIFATEKQAKSALAMARISQIMVNDERFGGPITDEEWNDVNLTKYSIIRYRDTIGIDLTRGHFHCLAFHTPEQRALFLKENEDLVKDYLMLD